LVGSHLAAKIAVIIGIRIFYCPVAESLFIVLVNHAALFTVAVGRFEVVSYILDEILLY
jgi:hypothetical protein